MYDRSGHWDSLGFSHRIPNCRRPAGDSAFSRKRRIFGATGQPSQLGTNRLYLTELRNLSRVGASYWSGLECERGSAWRYLKV